MSERGFRQGDLVRVTDGPQQGKIARIYGFTQPLNDFIGDPLPRMRVGLDADWAPEIPEDQRADGVFLLSQIEHYALGESV